MISLYLYSFIYNQVLPICNQLSDCPIKTYCGYSNLCYDCSYIEPGLCDVLDNNCCSPEFIKQCPTNPYQCPLPSTPEKSNKRNSLFMFNLIFFICSISYLSIGSYRNKYIKQKEGWSIIPNYESWNILFGLVKEGCQFSYRKIRGNPYEGLE